MAAKSTSKILAHKDIFTLSWDNDVVNLTKKEAERLIPLLQEFISQ